MTRINSSIRPIELCDKMLLAEHREIVRIPNVIKSGKADLNNIPQDFRLGQGHVKFFYNKIEYLHKRYVDIRIECIVRNFNVGDFRDSFNAMPKELYKDWQPDDNVRILLKDRINNRLSTMKSIKHCGEELPFERIKIL